MQKRSHAAFSQLPVVDISLLYSENEEDRQHVAYNLDLAVREAGFLYLKGHKVSSLLIEQLKEVVKEYFSLDLESKMLNYIGLSKNHSGYVPQGEEQFYSESKSDAAPDLKEGYDIGPESPSLMLPFEKSAVTQWPENVKFREVVKQYYEAMLGLSRLLFKAFALALKLPEDFFIEKLKLPPSQLRLLHYFDNPEAGKNDSGIGAHTDYEFFTILFPTSPGLQVLNGNNEWIDVPVLQDCFVLNIGDMMELISNGQYVATSHRVQQVKQERYSFPFFSSLDYDTVVEPISQFVADGEKSPYESLICGDHLLAQTIQTFKYLQKRLALGEIEMPSGSKGLLSFGNILKNTD